MSEGCRECDSIIDLRDVGKRYGTQDALSDIDLAIPRGQIVGLIGPSGCGKSTLVRLLTGSERPTSGVVRVFGKDPTAFTTRDRRRFGYMPQRPVLFPNLTVWGNLTFVASVYGLPVRHRRERLHSLLELVGMDDDRRKLLSECSGGMQRRTSLAATLVHDPELLFLDEPTAGIDPILRSRFWEHFRQLRDEGRTLIVPTQFVTEATSCDLVVVMSQGRVVTVQQPHRLSSFAFGGDALSVDLGPGWLSGEQLERLRLEPFVRSVRRSPDGLVVVVDDDTASRTRLATYFERAGIAVVSVEPAALDLDEVFVELMARHADATTVGATAAS